MEYTAAFGSHTLALELSSALPCQALLAACVATTLASMVPARAVGRALSVALLPPCVIFCHFFLQGFPYTLPADAIGALLPGPYVLHGAAAALGLHRVVVGLVIALERRAQPRLAALLFAGVLLGAATFGVARSWASGLPDGSWQVPELRPAGTWSAHVGLPRTVRAVLYDRGRRGWLGRTEPRPLAPSAGWRCERCEVTATAPREGPTPVLVQARKGALVLRAALPLQGVTALGDPRWPLRVGSRWTLHAYLGGSVEAGGWFVGMLTGTIVPQVRSHARNPAHDVVVSVPEAVERDGLRGVRVEIAVGTQRRSVEVFAEGGAYLVHEAGAAPRPLLEATGEPSEPLGVYPCSSPLLPVTACTRGTAFGLGPGPAGGWLRREGAWPLVQFFSGLFTLGAVVPGGDATEYLCLAHTDPGAGPAPALAPWPAFPAPAPVAPAGSPSSSANAPMAPPPRTDDGRWLCPPAPAPARATPPARTRRRAR